MAIPDDELASALRALLRMTSGFYVGFAGMLEVGQLENLNYWVESKDHKGGTLWYKDDIPLEEAIGHFLRIRRERELGYDIEIDLNPDLGHIGPAKVLTPNSRCCCGCLWFACEPRSGGPRLGPWFASEPHRGYEEPVMSQLMEQAFAKARELPEADQEAIAAIILQEIESESRWDELFARPGSADLLSRLADEALAGVRAGRARKLDLDEL